MAWPWTRRHVTPDELEGVRRDMKALRAEWLDWEDRLNRLYDRNRKAAQRAREAMDAKESATETAPAAQTALPLDPRAFHKSQLRQLANNLRGGNGHVAGG